ncbi:MAG: hypothetical protein H6744_19825 [Deltaproteobacteria bacterium]|nr:hypothetical protein [Deltaproteobacteria bacterium]
MNFSNLVERMVPLVAELFATLKVTDPLRMDFAGIAEKTVHDLVGVLRQEGLTNEEIAAALDLSIAGFYRKVKDLRETYSPGEGPRRPTLWEHIYDFVLEQSGGSHDRPVTFLAIEARFPQLSPDRLGAMLRYLVRFGRLSMTGHGPQRRYHIVERELPTGATYHDAVVTLYRDGPLTRAELAQRLEVDEQTCEPWLVRLRDAGRLEETTVGRQPARYRATGYHIEPEEPAGYEAALWDHFQAVVRAICKKVRLGATQASMGDLIGGTTFSFDLPVEDPLYAELSGFLAETRQRMEAWLVRHGEMEARPGARRVRVTIYTGQMVEELDE